MSERVRESARLCSMRGLLSVRHVLAVAHCRTPGHVEVRRGAARGVEWLGHVALHDAGETNGRGAVLCHALAVGAFGVAESLLGGLSGEVDSAVDHVARTVRGELVFVRFETLDHGVGRPRGEAPGVGLCARVGWIPDEHLCERW